MAMELEGRESAVYLVFGSRGKRLSCIDTYRV